MIVKNDLFDYKNRYIYQDTNGFKFTLDSILLAEFAKKDAKNKKLIIDACAGNMASSLILSKYTKSKFVGFEIQDKIAELAQMSIKENSLEELLSIINDDIKNIDNYYKRESLEMIICNPPYFKVTNLDRVNNKEKLSIARHELKLELEDVFKISSKSLKNKGLLFLVQRATRLDEIINLGYKYHLYVKELQFITTKKNDKPYIVLAKCVKNSKMGVSINKEICIEKVKTYQNIFGD